MPCVASLSRGLWSAAWLAVSLFTPQQTWLAQQIENDRNHRPHRRSRSLVAAVLDLRM